MLALRLHRAGLCNGCGRPLDETAGPGSEGAFRPLLPIVCHGCEAFSMAAKASEDQPHPRSLIHRVTDKRRP